MPVAIFSCRMGAALPISYAQCAVDELSEVYRCESGLEGAARDAALSDDGLQRADSDFGMVRNRDRYCSTISMPLHDYVTASLPNDLEAVLFKDAAHGLAGKDTEFTHAPLQSG